MWIVSKLLSNSSDQRQNADEYCSDPLPFKFLSRDSILCREAVFVDVDYKQLMGKKCEMIKTTPELRTVIGLEETISLKKDGVIIDCPNYKAVACDLEDMTGLDKVLTQTLDLKGDPVLFLAEVSITYMDALAAEKLVEWASTFSDGRWLSSSSRESILTHLSTLCSIRTILARW